MFFRPLGDGDENGKHPGANIYAVFGPTSELVDSYEKLCEKYNSRPTKYISFVAYSRGKEKHIWERSCFDSSHCVPYEFTEISIPDGYDARLKVEYHDYMQIVRASTTHGTMVLEPEIPYKDFLKEHSGTEIRQMMEGDETGL